MCHLGEKYLEGQELSVDDLRAAIRRATLAKLFIPVFMGSAFKDKGAQQQQHLDFRPFLFYVNIYLHT